MEKIKFEPLLKEIYKLSKKVSADLPFHATGIEKQLQETLAYEFRKASKPIEAVREFYAEIYYKDFPIKDYRPDFMIFPDKNWNLEKTLISSSLIISNPIFNFFKSDLKLSSDLLSHHFCASLLLSKVLLLKMKTTVTRSWLFEA